MSLHTWPKYRWNHLRCMKTARPWQQHRHLAMGRPSWTTDMETSTKYPLSVELREKLRPAFEPQAHKRRAKHKKQHLRPQIVSPDLCDDVLSHIGPSLQKHKGCDILDLNPGVGLWSSKLHDFLQPRSHLLIESAPDTFSQWIDPLLDKAGSKYKLVQADPCEFSTYDQLIVDGYLPHQKRIVPGDAGAQEPNNSLLVTGTLMWDPKLPGFGFDSMAKQMLDQFIKLSWRNQIFHALGPVRMLLWMLTDELKFFLPRGIVQVSKTNFFVRKMTDAKEVVTPPHTERIASRHEVGREPRYELESLVQAMKRAKQNGLELPADRRENIHDFADDIMGVSNGTGIIDGVEYNRYLKEQELAGKSVAGIVGDPTIKTWHMEQPDDEEARKLTFNQIRTRQRTAQRLDTVRKERDELVDIAEDIYHGECDILKMEDGSEKGTKTKELEKKQAEWENRLGTMQEMYIGLIESDIDDRISLRTKVPRLHWDERSFEPLIMQKDEVWPIKNVSLMDVTPRPMPEDQSAEHFEYLQDFIYGLYSREASTLPQALESMHHGASDLIDQIPSLRDPSKGGRLNMNNMRVRMLTVEIIDELCRAFREWPFLAPDAGHSRYFRSRNIETGRIRNDL